MKLLDLLFTAGSGGIVGSLLHLGTAFFEVYRKRKEAEVEIMLLNAKVAAAEKQAAWAAFTASQSQPQTVTVASGAAPWAATLATLVDAFRAVTRPALTWALLVFLLVVFLKTPPDQRVDMTNEITFGSFTALFWWFGSRYAKSSAK